MGAVFDTAINQQFQRAMQLHQSGRMSEARLLYEQVIAQQPRHADSLHYLGVLMAQLGNPQRGADMIQAAIEINPKAAMYHGNLGTILNTLGRSDQATAAYRRAIALEPNDPLAHCNLGNALREIGRPREAADACRWALKLKPDYAEAYTNLGNALAECGEPEQSLAAYRRAVEIRPDLAESHNNLGNALSTAGRLDDAVGAFQKAIALSPNLAAPHMGLGFVLASQGLIEKAFECYSRSTSLDPGNAANGSFRVYAANFHPDKGPSEILRLAREWAGQHASASLPRFEHHMHDRSPHRKLKIGYVSPDFRDFVMGWLSLPIFEHHNHDEFEVHCFSSTRRPDSLTARIRDRVAHFHDVPKMSDATTAQLIYDQQIDILIDLAVHTTGNRLLVLARKPAPLQISFLAYFGTTGLTEVDYLLGDHHLIPQWEDVTYVSERTWPLTGAYWCYRPRPDSPPPGPLPSIANGYITFGCLNSMAKVNSRVLDVWIRILQLIPRSHLMLLSPEGSVRERIRQLATNNDIDASRIQFVSRQSPVNYLACHQQIDITLDPFPYGGGNTTCDSLWMGVPVISLAGSKGVSRGGLSVLSHVGLGELTANCADNYVKVATTLARDIPQLSLLRSTLRQRMQASPLMNERQYATGLETAYRSIWTQWCEAHS